MTYPSAIISTPIFLKRICLVLLSIFLFSFNLFTQELILKGQILDAQSAEAIPFATVSVLHTSLGESADFEGYFELRLSQVPDSLLISALGYQSIVLSYEKQDFFNIKLDAAAYSLDEIVVRPTEDPAKVLFQKVLENKPNNNPDFMPQYSCEIYDKLQLDLVNITEPFQDFFLNRPFKFAFEKIDSLSEDEPFLPMFLTEKLSDYQYKKNPQSKEQTIKASKVSGFKNAGIAELLDVLYQNFNIYNNWIPILTKEFASPISDAGFNYYNYYLVDSATINKQWCYQVQFFPKSKSSPTFSGDFWVHDSTYAIKRVNLFLSERANLNYVEKMNIVQEYTSAETKFWHPKKTHMTVTFDKVTKPLLLDWFSKRIENNAPNIQGKRSTYYRNYKDELLTKSIIEPNTSLEKEEAYWKKNRHIALTDTEQEIHKLIDTVQQLPVFNSWKRWTTLIFSGYIPVGSFDIGNAYNIYSRRPIEGNRFKFGWRTNSKLSKKWVIGTYLAYGTEDKKFKFGLNSLYVFQKYPRRVVSGTVIKDILQTASLNNQFSLSSEGLLAADFIRQSKIPFKLLNIENYRFSYFHEQLSGLAWQLSAEHQKTAAFFNFNYQTDASDTYEAAEIEEFSHTAISLRLRYAYKEKFLSGVFNRVSLGSKFPVVSVEYKRGLKNILESGFNFHRLDFSFYDRIEIAPLGYLKTNIDAGKIWGRLPYLLLFTAKGNEGLFSNYDGFNLIPNFTFATDRYIRASVDHHFDGFIFKKIPLLKKLDWRTVANYRILWGDLSPQNRQANTQNLYENTTTDELVRIRVPNTTPYMETSIGIENILKIFRLDFVWKLNYREPSTQHWGLRANLNIKF